MGAITRFSISKQLNKNSSLIPRGTLTANLSGSFILGMIAGAKSNPMITLSFGIGFVGALTTFSTLQLEIEQIKDKFRKVILICTVYGAGLILAFGGYLVGKNLFNL